MNRVTMYLLLITSVVPVQHLMAGTASSEVSGITVIIDLLLLVAGLLCFVTSLKIFSLLRGGELSSGWQMISVSFLLFSIAQTLDLSLKLEVFILPENAVNLLQAVTLFMIFLGVAKIKKALT